jgi:hypothetical protein
VNDLSFFGENGVVKVLPPHDVLLLEHVLFYRMCFTQDGKLFLMQLRDLVD